MQTCAQTSYFREYLITHHTLSTYFALFFIIALTYTHTLFSSKNCYRMLSSNLHFFKKNLKIVLSYSNKYIFTDTFNCCSLVIFNQSLIWPTLKLFAFFNYCKCLINIFWGKESKVWREREILNYHGGGLEHELTREILFMFFFN